MIRNSVSLLVAPLLLWMPFPVECAERNLVPDSSFEEPRILEAWSVQEPAGTSVRLDRTVARTGKSSLCIETLPGHEEDTYPAVKFRVRPKPGERYRAEVWIKSQCKNQLGGFIVLETTRGEQRFELIDGDQPGPTTDGWVKASAATVIAPGAEGLSLGLVAHGAGRAWFDDVTFVKVAEAPPQPPPGLIRLEVQADAVINPRFDGFGGGYGDLQLWTGYARSLGIDAQDISLIADRLKAMRPHIARLWYGYEYEPEEGKFAPASEPMVNLVNTIRLYKEAGTEVVLNAMGDYFAYPPWMKEPGSTSKLPAPAKREAMVRSYVEAVKYLRRDLGLNNVRYLALFVEPGNDYHRPVPPEEYVRLHKLLDEILQQRRLRKEVLVLGSFDCAGPAHGLDPWCAKVLKAGLAQYVDVITAHTYRHRNVLSMDPWVQVRLEAIQKAASGGPARPFWITEFGYSNFLGNSTFENPEMRTYEYGLFAADFAVEALRNRVSAALIWCLAPVYYSDQIQQKASLWEHKDRRWEPRPPFYSWSLLCRYTRPGSQVLATKTEPQAADLRSVALRTASGEITLLIVNRCLRDLALEVQLPAGSKSKIREFLYSRNTVPTLDRAMLRPRAVHAVTPGKKIPLSIPQDAFLMLTEIGE
ncbi:MAG: hypothetical protein ACLQNE_12850 [Thermoguttaceae bacterium]